jgi:repressor LexA
MTDHPSPRQQQILDLIRRHLERYGVPPSRAEITAALGLRSVNGVQEQLRALARKGLIELSAGTARGIRLAAPGLTDRGPTDRGGAGEIGLPVVGRVAAGSPILAAQQVEGHYAVAPTLFRPRADYLLRVHGSSMRDAGILDGDLLAVHRTPQADNGRIVVARLGDEVTVKRLQRSPRWPHRVSLLAENPDFDPIELDLRRDELVIEGVGVGLLRDNLGQPIL